MSTSLTFSLLKGILCFTLFLTFSFDSTAQINQEFVTIKKGKAYLNSGREFKFKKVTETESSFIFLTMNKTEVELDKTKITRIDKRNGNKGLRYALISLGSTYLLVNTLAYIDGFNSENPFPPFEEEALYLSVAFSIFTVPLGGLIGLTQKKYKTVYSSSLIGNYEPHLELKTTLPNAVPSITLSYTF